MGCSMSPEARDLLKLPEKPAGTAWRASTIRQDGLLQGLPLASPLLAAPPKPSTAWRSPRDPRGNRGLTQEVGPIPGPRNQLDLLSGCRALLAALQSGILPCRELGLNETWELGTLRPPLAEVGFTCLSMMFFCSCFCFCFEIAVFEGHKWLHIGSFRIQPNRKRQTLLAGSMAR